MSKENLLPRPVVDLSRVFLKGAPDTRGSVLKSALGVGQQEIMLVEWDDGRKGVYYRLSLRPVSPLIQLAEGI